MKCPAGVVLRGTTMGFFLLLPAAMQAQTTQQPDVWEGLKYFVGSWEGAAAGQAGDGKVEREYQFVLNGRFLHMKNRSTYPPQEKNPKGEVHDHWDLFSYDRQRRQFVLRQFHVEGFVNQYALDAATSSSTTLVFVSESIENIRPGWRAKETYRLLGADEFIEVFELAAPGGEFEVYTENHLRRRMSGTVAAARPSSIERSPDPRLYRVILPVQDVEQAAKFYTELLGIEGMRVSPGRHYFNTGGVILALYDPKADGDNREPRPNFEHVYLAVSDLGEVYKRAERLGGLSQEVGDGNLPMGKIATRPWGERSFYLKDPFGNPLCFVDEKTLFTGH